MSKEKSNLKYPEEMTLAELRPYMAEYVRRQRLGKAARPRIEKPCRLCGTMLSARARRLACPTCGAYNREVK